MTREETLIILGIIKVAYPRFYLNIKKEDANNTVDLWTEMLEDYELEVVKVAVKKLIAEMVFPPTIADVRKLLVETTTERIIDASEAWGQVKRAISLYGQYQEEKALESLDDSTRQIVKRLGFKELCRSETEMADRAHFIKLYDNYVKEQKRDKQIPLQIKQASELIQQNYNKNIISLVDRLSV